MTKFAHRPLQIFFLGFILASPVSAQKKLTAAEAKQHFGETATVCGEVVSARYAESSKGHPTFLNLDKPYPKPIFTVVIWTENRSKFGKPEEDYKGKQICVSGKDHRLCGFAGDCRFRSQADKTRIVDDSRHRSKASDDLRSPSRPWNLDCSKPPLKSLARVTVRDLPNSLPGLGLQSSLWDVLPKLFRGPVLLRRDAGSHT